MTNIITLILMSLIVVWHWKTEIKKERIYDLPNLLLLIIGVIRIYTIHPDEKMFYLHGALIAFSIPIMLNYFIDDFYVGGGVYKLLISSGLILGFYQMSIILLISPILYFGYVELTKKYSWYRYPSGVSVLAMLPFHIGYLFLK